MKPQNPLGWIARRLPGEAFGAGLIALLLLASAAAAPAAERKTVNTHVAEVTSRLRPMASLPAANRLHVDIGLPLRNRPGLDALVRQMYNRSSPNFHRYLTPDQFAEQFGPTEQDYARVQGYARSNRLSIVRTFSNRALVSVEGAVDDIQRTFGVRLGTYQHPTENRQFYGPDVEPSVPAELPVLYLSGLDNYRIPRRNGHRVDPAGSHPPAQRGGSYSNGLYIGNDFRNAYLPGTSLNGSGQVVGLFEADGYTPSDIQTYETAAGLPSVPVVNVLNSWTPGSGNDEVASDIELAIAMAPGITQVNVYEGSNDEIINAMATVDTASEPRPNQLSCSWGVSGDTTIEQGLIQLTAQGQSFLYAVGDSGAYANGVLDGSQQDFIYMTAVGGTQLFMNGAGVSWNSEIVWHDPPPTNFNYFASTGGVLPDVPIPYYQQGLSMTLSQGSSSARNVPDVALVARDIEIVFTVVPKSGSSTPGHFSGWVGTSAAAPLWAGIIALANQEAAGQGKPPVGFLNPALYAIAEGTDYAADFHDITSGNNAWADSVNGTSSGGLYSATVGYDLCTGWGTPASTGLLDDLVGLAGPVYVDFNYGGSPQNGQYPTPYGTLAQGVSGVSSGGTIFIERAGSSSETMTISKPLTINANDGPATVGN